MLCWRFIMSATKSSGTCIAFRTPRRNNSTGPRADPAHGRLPLPPMDKAGLEVVNRFSDRFELTGVDISLEEYNELNIFDEFLARHVQPNGICDVQCMLLWSEWVRTFRHRIPGFPNLIRENEFRNVIMDKFGVGIADDGFRGKVYPGIRFVP